jgi:hypothetical protein
MHKSSLLRKRERDLEESVEPKADIEHQDRLVKV